MEYLALGIGNWQRDLGCGRRQLATGSGLGDGNWQRAPGSAAATGNGIPKAALLKYEGEATGGYGRLNGDGNWQREFWGQS